MVTCSSILPWKTSMDRGAWWATVHGGHKELDMTEHIQTNGTEFRVQKSTYTLIFDKGAKIIQWGKNSLFQKNGAREAGYPHAQG